MRRLLLGLIFLVSLNLAKASFVPRDSAKATVEIAETIRKQHELAVMKMVSEMSVKDYEKMTGKKMNLIDRLSFKTLKSRFKKMINGDRDGNGFNIWGFLLGFSFGLIGVLISYASKDSNFRKWAWIGFGFFGGDFGYSNPCRSFCGNRLITLIRKRAAFVDNPCNPKPYKYLTSNNHIR